MALAAVMIFAGSSMAYNVEYGDETAFTRDLVNDCKKSVIAIWIFGDNGMALGSQGIGSGVIFQAVPEENAAYALTNHHVAGESALLQCETWDRGTYKAQLVATEPGIDAALIKIFDIPADAYEPCVLGDSDQLKPGDLTLAMGAPGTGLSVNSNRSDPMIDFGLHLTATMRVMLGRNENPYEDIATWAGWKQGQGGDILINSPWRVITQAAVNGGNSGGPLFNSRAECIALNHAGRGMSATVLQDFSMSIPINQVKNFAFQILQTGKYELPWFGLDILVPPSYYQGKTYQAANTNISQFAEDYLNERQVKVLNIRKNSPASRTGLQVEDVIVEFDGIEFSDPVAMRSYIFTLPIGKQVPVIVERKVDATHTETVELMLEVGVKRSYDADFSV